jgi:hypothetical protein
MVTPAAWATSSRPGRARRPERLPRSALGRLPDGPLPSPVARSKSRSAVAAPLRSETKGQARACPDRTWAIPCTVRAVTRCGLPGKTADDMPAACPIGWSMVGTYGHSRAARYTCSPANRQADPFLGQKYRRIARRRGARIDPERRKRTHIRELEALGYTVTLKPAV